jgi:phage I-like protein
MTKEFKKTKTNDKYRGIFPLEFGEKKKNDEGEIPDTIHMIPVGQWEHDLYGPIIINSSDIREFIQNFNARVRKGVFITAGHEGYEELPAVGWVTEVEQRDDGLWGKVEWNERGRTALTEKEFKFFSPEMCRDYEDPETHQFYRNVVTGGALTKSPYFKELQSIVFSDKNLQTKFNEKQTMSKTLEEILAIEDIATLTDEDKAVLKESADKLNDDQKVKYTAIIDAPADGEAETEEAKVAREAKEAEEKAAADKAAADAAAAGGEQALSEKKMVTINASELAILRAKADKGDQAYRELETKEISDSLSKMIFSAENKKGRFLPKSQAGVKAFMEKLPKDMRKAFSDLIAELPENGKFSEVGANNAIDTTTQAEIDAKVATKQKDNPKMSYSDALKAVFSENGGLEERYDSELQGKAE